MGIAQTLNRNPAIATGGVVLLIALVVGFIIYSQASPARSTTPARAFYTNDDGLHWFVDDAEKLTPFIKDGKEAVRAHVFACANGSDQFVGYMERSTAETRKKLEDLRTASKGNAPAVPGKDVATLAGAMQTDIEYKKPGDANWVKLPDAASVAKIFQVQCPKDKSANVTPVTPE